jgi:O-antigen ligase
LLSVSVFLFFVFIILLSARTATMSFIVIILIAGFYLAKTNKKLSWFFGIALILMLISTLIVYNSPFLKERIFDVVDSKLYFDPKENNATGLTLRLVKWTCSIEGFKTNPMMGVGIGDTQDFLQSCYKERNFWGQVFHYNSHNQFFQTALGLGVIGLTGLMFFLFYPLIGAFKNRDYFLIAFLTLVSIACVTESILERKQGVIFVSFFYSLFALGVLSKNN